MKAYSKILKGMKMASKHTAVFQSLSWMVVAAIALSSFIDTLEWSDGLMFIACSIGSYLNFKESQLTHDK